jgi:hypothetical protein
VDFGFPLRRGAGGRNDQNTIINTCFFVCSHNYRNIIAGIKVPPSEGGRGEDLSKHHNQYMLFLYDPMITVISLQGSKFPLRRGAGGRNDENTNNPADFLSLLLKNLL